MKVVVNHCYGTWEIDPLFAEELKGHTRRVDPVLIDYIEKYGKAISGKNANLEVEEIPDGSKFRITDYDGYEEVEYFNEGDYYIACSNDIAIKDEYWRLH